MVNGTKELETVSQSTHIADRRVGFNHCASHKMQDFVGQAQKKQITTQRKDKAAEKKRRLEQHLPTQVPNVT